MRTYIAPHQKFYGSEPVLNDSGRVIDSKIYIYSNSGRLPVTMKDDGKTVMFMPLHKFASEIFASPPRFIVSTDRLREVRNSHSISRLFEVSAVGAIRKNVVSAEIATSSVPTFYFNSNLMLAEIDPGLRETKRKAKKSLYALGPVPKLKYNEVKPYFRAITIPVKFRPKLTNVQPQAESGLNFAFSSGIKASLATFKTPMTLSETRATMTSSVSLGYFLGLAATDVNPKTTSNKVSDLQATKNAIMPTGLVLIYGINSINFGAALGMDMIFGPNRDKWIYRHKRWYGVIIGIDIIK
ncbi:hypothetical protein ACWKW6_31815 [Dyadobacter jiangsuensis]